MRLENELYKVLALDDKSARIQLLPDSAIFQAHFPGNPVTPGVCQVGMVEELAEEMNGCQLILREVKILKFLEVLRPQSGKEVVFAFEKMEEAEGEWNVKGTIMSENQVYTKFSLVFERI